MTYAKWLSPIDVHPGGDNLIIGSYDSRLSWFDLDLSTKPYKTLNGKLFKVSLYFSSLSCINFTYEPSTCMKKIKMVQKWFKKYIG